jgi:hypothetical protein
MNFKFVYSFSFYETLNDKEVIYYKVLSTTKTV